MDNNTKQNIAEHMPEQFLSILEETVGKTLLEEANQYRGIADKIKELLNGYLSKSVEILDQNRITGFLFESYNAASKINEILQENVQDAARESFLEELNLFNAKTIKALNIEVDEETEGDKDIIKNTLSNVQDKLKNVVNNILKKKPVNDQTYECYLFSRAIYDVLLDHLNKIDAYEKSRLNIILNLWEKSKLINENISLLTQKKFELEVAKEEFITSLNFEDTAKLIEENASQASLYIQSIKEAIKLAYEVVERERQTQDSEIAKRRNQFNADQVLRSSKKIEKEFRIVRVKWQNTMMVLADDWELDLEVNALEYHILKGFFGFTQYVDTRFKVLLNEKIDKMQSSIEDLLVLFEPTEGLKSVEILSNLKKGKSDFRRKLLLRLMPEIRELLVNNEIPKEIDEFEKDALKEFDALSTSKYIIKNPAYDHPVERSEMNKISPHDLISFDIQPHFMDVFPRLKNAIIRQVQVLQVSLEEIPEIVDFSIESAIGYFDDKNDIKESLKIGKEGINRAINKINDLQDSRKEFYTTEVDFLGGKINQLISKITEITDNESALQIKLRVTKSKAIEQSKAVRDRVIKKIKDFLPLILRKVKTFYEFIVASSIKIRKQLEGEVTKGFITTDISDYLGETEDAVNRLPFVYQRLFKLEPLSTFDLYIERKEAQDKFKRAYARWKIGKFAPTIVIGEKGSGKTSFINRLLSSKSINEGIIYHDLFKEYLSPDEILIKIEESIPGFSNKPNEADAELPKKIIVIDGLEKLFEARINGFISLQKLLKLISGTNRHIFWVVSCHIYSYKYLDKSINISDYFGYHIELENLTSEELITMIEKRHNISGFRLNFLPNSQKKSILPIIKQGDNNDQLELKTLYFDRLQKIVLGNITQAFLHWMRSAAKVTEDIIYIKMPGDKSLDFVKSISASKFEILKNMLIHNGISAGKHAAIYRIPQEKSELQLEQLYDDGIIIKKNEIYYINPMIYKQVVDQMYLLNLIH